MFVCLILNISTHIQGTPGISDMALLAIRNHVMLSHWVSDAVKVCVQIVGGDADNKADAFSIDQIGSRVSSRVNGQAVSGDKGRNNRNDSSIGDQGNGDDYKSNNGKDDPSRVTPGCVSTGLKKRSFNDISNETRGINANRNRHGHDMKVLLQLYELCEVLDIEDDRLSLEEKTQEGDRRIILYMYIWSYAYFICAHIY